MNEQKKYEVIKALADHEHPNKQRAALTLGCTVRHINRMLNDYKEFGKQYFVHGNRGRKPANTIDNETRRRIIDLYLTKYYNANFEHYTELLGRHEDIHVSPTTVSSILESEYILSPKVTKAKKKRIREELKAKKETAMTQKEVNQIQANLVSIEDAHSRRPRAAYFGELEQMDATPYEWIPGQIWHLHLAIDDASGRIVGGWFDTQETLNGYYHVFYQILTTYGIPYKFFTDRRTVFTCQFAIRFASCSYKTDCFAILTGTGLEPSTCQRVTHRPKGSGFSLRFIKRKTPHLSMRILIHNLRMLASSWELNWSQAAFHKQKVV